MMLYVAQMSAFQELERQLFLPLTSEKETNEIER